MNKNIFKTIISTSIITSVGYASPPSASPSSNTVTRTKNLSNGNITATYNYNTHEGTVTGPYQGTATITGNGNGYATITGGPFHGTAQVTEEQDDNYEIYLYGTSDYLPTQTKVVYSPQYGIETGYVMNPQGKVEFTNTGNLQVTRYSGGHMSADLSGGAEQFYTPYGRDVYTSPYGIIMNGPNGLISYDKNQSILVEGPQGKEMTVTLQEGYPGEYQYVYNNNQIATGTGTPRSYMTITGSGYFTDTPDEQMTRELTQGTYTTGYYTAPTITGQGTYLRGYYTIPVVTSPATMTTTTPYNTYTATRTYNPTSGIQITGGENTQGGTLSYYQGKLYYNGSELYYNPSTSSLYYTETQQPAYLKEYFPASGNQ